MHKIVIKNGVLMIMMWVLCNDRITGAWSPKTTYLLLCAIISHADNDALLTGSIGVDCII